MLVTAAVLGATAGVAVADDLPKRRPGNWEMTMSGAGGAMQGQKMSMCIDATTDAAMMKNGMGMTKDMCSKMDLHVSGGVVITDSICQMGPTKMTGHSATTFTGDAAYHTEAVTHFDPPMGGKAESTMTQDAKWTGPCAPGMQPGDMLLPGGQKVNMKQMGGGNP